MRPVLITDDGEILEHCLRVAAVVGIDIELVPDAGAARARWGAGDIVLVGADMASAVTSADLGRRPGVLVVCAHEPEAELWRAAVHLGAEHVVQLPDADRWLVGRLGDNDPDPVQRGRVIGVRGAHGGIGTSTLAIGIALAAARSGSRVLLVDADVCSGGIDVLLGIESESGMRWPDLVASRGRIIPSELDAALPQVNGVSVLSWGRESICPVPDEGK